MSLTLSSATARITNQLNNGERLIATALAEMASLTATLSTAQIEVENAPRAKVQAVILRSQAASQRLIEAQAEMLRAHGQLASIGREMMGPEEHFCPDEAFTSGELTDEVAKAA